MLRLLEGVCCLLPLVPFSPMTEICGFESQPSPGGHSSLVASASALCLASSSLKGGHLAGGALRALTEVLPSDRADKLMGVFAVDDDAGSSFCCCFW